MAKKAADEMTKEKLKYDEKCQELTRHFPLTGYKITNVERKPSTSQGMVMCVVDVDFYVTNITYREIESCTCQVYLKNMYQKLVPFDVDADTPDPDHVRSAFVTCTHVRPQQACVCHAKFLTTEDMLVQGMEKPAWRVTQIDFVPAK